MIVWIFAIFIAFFVKGLCGFANTLVFDTTLSHQAVNSDISPVELLLGLPTNVILAYKNRESLRLKICAPIIVLVLLGSILGSLLLKHVHTGLLKIILGIVIILVGVEIYTRDHGWISIKSNRFLLIGFGFLSGMMCGLFGIGALLAAYVGRVAENNDEFKANLSAVFIVENIFRIITYTEIGLLNLEVLHKSIYLCPYMIIGLILGMESCRLLDEKKVKVIVIIALIISGVALIVRNI